MPGAVATHSDAVHVVYLDVNDFDEFEWDDLIDFIRGLSNTWKSLRDMDKWAHRDIHIICGNDLISIGIAEYCGMAAISIFPDLGDSDTPVEFAEKWASQVCDKIQDHFDQAYPGLTLNKTSAWTSEVRQTSYNTK